MKAFTQKIRPIWFFIAVPIVALLILIVVLISIGNRATASVDYDAANPSALLEPSPTPTANPSEEAVLPPAVSSELPPSPTPDENPPSSPSPSTGFHGFSYNGAVPESAPVEDAWFSDAVFLGDSRTDGFRLHSGLTDSHIYGEKNISVFNAASKTTIRLDDGSYGTLLDALALRQYKKVYVMLGINELGYPVSSYREAFELFTDQVRALQPDADIYIQALIPVTLSRATGDSVYNNTNIQAFNQQLADICEQDGYYYIDTYTAFADENGALPEDAAWDGIHLTASGCLSWLDYLKTHTITD